MNRLLAGIARWLPESGLAVKRIRVEQMPGMAVYEVEILVAADQDAPAHVLRTAIVAAVVEDRGFNVPAWCQDQLMALDREYRESLRGWSGKAD